MKRWLVVSVMLFVAQPASAEIAVDPRISLTEFHRHLESLPSEFQLRTTPLAARLLAPIADRSRDDSNVAVHVQARESGDLIDVSIEVTEPAQSWWYLPFLRFPERRVQHAYLVRNDAMVHALLREVTPLTEDNVSVRNARLRSRGYVALAVHDLDGDQRAEILLVDENAQVEVYRPRGQALTRVAEAPLPNTPRIRARRRIFGTTLKTARSVRFRLSSRPFDFLATLADDSLTVTMPDARCPEGAHELDDGCARPVAGRDYFNSTLEAPEGQEPPRQAQASFYARRVAQIVATDGSRHLVEAIVTPQGRLAVRVDDQPSGVLGHGAALAMADVDLDGNAELLTSSSAELGGGDRLMITRARADGVILEVWRSGGVGGSVLLADAGDLDGDGRAEFVAIEEPTGNGRARAWVVSCAP